ncbi:MAG TPA: N-acetylglucosamine-6-phosphate deacetylase [Alphaproteobacteria bacterium]
MTTNYTLRANLVLTDRIMTGGYVHIHDNVIQSIAETPVENIEIIDHSDSYLMPGLIDLQVNGGGGMLFNDVKNTDDIRTIVDAHLKYGTTGLLATLITDAPEQLTTQLALIGNAIRHDAYIAQHVLGIHLEGPFFNLERRGTHPPQYVMEPSVAWMEKWIEAAQGTLKIVTLAPELPNALDVIALLRKHDIAVSLGHSDATYDDVNAAIAQGATLGTHLFNAMSQWQGRAPNMVGTLVDHPLASVSLINDGHHVHDVSLRMVLKAKPLDQIFFVSDAMHVIEPGEAVITYRGMVMQARDGVCFNQDGKLAGSVSPLFAALRRAVSHLGLTLPEAARLASTNPARVLTLGHRGKLAVGTQGPFLLVSTDLQALSLK